ncbi:MAG: response regulator [Pseudomonadota bacterium]
MKTPVRKIVLAVSDQHLLETIRSLLAARDDLHLEPAIDGNALFMQLSGETIDCLIIGERVGEAPFSGVISNVRSGQFCAPTTPILLIGAFGRAAIEHVAKNYFVAALDVSEIDCLSEALDRAIEETPKPTLLIIEDSFDQLEQLIEYLSAGFHIYPADNGVDGFKLYRDKKPDIVLTDYNMPEFNGEDVVAAIRKTDADTPIVVLTAHDEPENSAALTIVGATRFISKKKPVSEIEIICRNLFLEQALLSARKTTSHAATKLDRVTHAMNLALEEMETGQHGAAGQRIKSAITVHGGDQSSDDTREE